jgi:hypothetical protein
LPPPVKTAGGIARSSPRSGQTSSPPRDYFAERTSHGPARSASPSRDQAVASQSNTGKQWIAQVEGGNPKAALGDGTWKTLGRFNTLAEAQAAEKKWNDAHPGNLRLTRELEVPGSTADAMGSTGTDAAGKLQSLADSMNRVVKDHAERARQINDSLARNPSAGAAQRVYGKVGQKAAANLTSDTMLAAELRTAAQNSKFFSEGELKTIMAIESKADRNTGKNKYGYAGLFQMGPGAAKDAGYKYKDLDEPSEWRTNLAAGIAFLNKNAERLQAKGIPVTPLNAYLAHQQGVAGATRILTAVQDGSASTTPARKNQLANLPRSLRTQITKTGKQVTIQDYYDYWVNVVNAVDTSVNSRNTPLP